jgi:hypothetical protein
MSFKKGEVSVTSLVEFFFLLIRWIAPFDLSSRLNENCNKFDYSGGK